MIEWMYENARLLYWLFSGVGVTFVLFMIAFVKKYRFRICKRYRCEHCGQTMSEPRDMCPYCQELFKSLFKIEISNIKIFSKGQIRKRI